MEFIERAFASDKNKESDIERRFLEFLMEILSKFLKWNKIGIGNQEHIVNLWSNKN